MKWLFDMDNPVMRTLSMAADLMILNLLALLCCLPVVTAGAALTALNAAAIKIVRGEETTPVKDYFLAFRANFKKGTLLGLLLLVILAVLGVDALVARQLTELLQPVLGAMALLVLMVSQYAFALLARYENTIWGTLKNAMLLSIGYFPRTLAMTAFTLALWLLALSFLGFGVPILFLFGLSLPCYVTGLLMQAVFKKLENQ